MSSVDCKAAPFIRTPNDRPWVDPGATTRGRPASDAAESSLRFGRLDWPWVKGKFISRDFACERTKSLLVCGLEQTAHNTQHKNKRAARRAGRMPAASRAGSGPAAAAARRARCVATARHGAAPRARPQEIDRWKFKARDETKNRSFVMSHDK